MKFVSLSPTILSAVGVVLSVGGSLITIIPDLTEPSLSLPLAIITVFIGTLLIVAGFVWNLFKKEERKKKFPKIIFAIFIAYWIIIVILASMSCARCLPENYEERREEIIQQLEREKTEDIKNFQN